MQYSAMVAGRTKEGIRMKNCLLFLAVVATLVVGAPAYSQYIFADTNGYGKSSLNPANAGAPDDILIAGTQNVDVYYVTNTNRDPLSTAVCADGGAPMTINVYQFVVRSSGSGSVVYNGWTDAVGFTTGLVIGGSTPFFSAAGTDAWIAAGQADQLAPGKYKVGTLNLTVTGTPKLDFVTSSTLHTSAITGFGTNCLVGPAFDGFVRLGSNFMDADGTSATTPVVPTTWGKIKNLYK